MRNAILFWCYKEPELCRARVALLRHYNPHLPIYVLFGGEAAAAPAMAAALDGLYNDFLLFAEDRDPRWKWLNGDLLIADWYRRRGAELAGWDRLFVAQWDMVVAAPVDRLLAGMGPRDVLLSGARRVREVRGWWYWVQGRERRRRLLGFRLRMILRGYFGRIWACVFVGVALPREFLDYHARLADEHGFIEYRVPTLARAAGFRFWSSPAFDPWWAADPTTTNLPGRESMLRAVPPAIDPPVLQAELANPRGRRVFHPVGELPVEVDSAAFEAALA